MAEEPVQPEVEQVAEPAPEEPKPAEAAPDTSDRDARLAKLPDTLREAFDGDHDEEELEAVAEELTADHFRQLDPRARVALRAVLKRDIERETKRKSEDEERTKAFEAEKAKHAAELKRFRQEKAALFALARSPEAAAPGDRPEVDPFTPEGAAKLVEWASRDETNKKLARLAERDREEQKGLRWAQLVETYPDLNDPKVEAEFDAYVINLNPGVDPAKGDKPKVPAALAARIFFNERENAKLKAEAEARNTRERIDRAASARSVGRSFGGGTPDALARYDALHKQDKDAAHELLERDPAVKKAVLQRSGVALH